jgi:hypothetical protein
LWEKHFLEKEQKGFTFFPLIKNFFLKQKFKKRYFLGLSKYSENFVLLKRPSFEVSGEKVFWGEDRSFENTDKKEKGFWGLKNQQLFFHKGKPIYLIDNHNKALFPFLEVSKVFKVNSEQSAGREGALGCKVNSDQSAGREGEFLRSKKRGCSGVEGVTEYNKKFDIVHIDAHPDDANFSKDLPSKISYKNINWCLENSRVSDYLDLAQKTSLVGKVLNITQVKEFEDFCSTKILPKNFILNLDIDIFGPEGDYIDLELKIESIAKAWEGSTAVVLATSPGYIDQDEAKKIIEIFLKNSI